MEKSDRGLCLVHVWLCVLAVVIFALDYCSLGVISGDTCSVMWLSLPQRQYKGIRTWFLWLIHSDDDCDSSAQVQYLVSQSPLKLGLLLVADCEFCLKAKIEDYIKTSAGVSRYKIIRTILSNKIKTL